MAACFALAGTPHGVASAAEGALLTLGYPHNSEVSFGNVIYGATPPHVVGGTKGLNFRICGTVTGDDTIVAYGLTRGDKGLPQVWRARTRDGLVFTDAEMLFETTHPS